MNPDQTLPREQSDLGPYCLQEHKQTRGADNKTLHIFKCTSD